jgi:tetratricopeptide (TPR) repeat protein
MQTRSLTFSVALTLMILLIIISNRDVKKEMVIVLVTNRRWLTLMASLVMGALILTGCANNKPQQPSASTAVNATAQQSERPALVVPASFDTPAAKQEFAIKAVDDGYYAEVKPLLESLVAANPDADVYEKLGTTQYNLNDLTGAMEAWRKAAELDPQREARMTNFVGNAQRDARLYSDAEASYRKALELDPTQWNAAINLATLLKTNGKKQEAVTVLEVSVPANPEVKSLITLLEDLRTEDANNEKPNS